MSNFDPTPFLTQDEGQHFDRKSLYHGPPGEKSGRDRKGVRDQVAEYVAAFANAEGGVLILGLEDDGEVSGHSYPEHALESLLRVPQTRLQPALSAGFIVECDGQELIVFDVAAADVPVQVTGDGFPLRMGDQTVQASESQIASLKFHGMAESWESKPSPLSLENLDLSLIAAARVGAGLGAISDEDYLLRRKLADRRGHTIAMRRAAELLFAEYGPEHANAGVRIFRVVGTERRLGAEHNVEERPRIEGPLPKVLEETMRTISGLLRRPSRLVGTKFQPAPEYPDFAWREAVLNAVAHRDYFVEGRAIEIWLYDDRMEVINPGSLMPEVSLQSLRKRERLHASRNPRLVRSLVDLGYMRDQGEGIPRMFYEMQDSFLPVPELNEMEHSFSVTLRNTPVLSESDKSFVGRYADEDLSREEFRALLEAQRHERVDNARMRRVAGLDTLQASQLLRRLRDRGYLQLHPAGSASYYTLASEAEPEEFEAKPEELGDKPEELGDKPEELGNKPEELGNKPEELGDKPEELGNKPEGFGNKPEGFGNKPEELDEAELNDKLSRMPNKVRQLLDSLGSRPRRETMRRTIIATCSVEDWTAGELARVLGRNPTYLTETYLSPLVDEGLLERTREAPTDPRQGYRSTSKGLGPLFDVRGQEE